MIARVVKRPAFKVAVGAAAVGSAIALYDDRKRREAGRILHAGWRISNLVVTAGIMVGDYTYNLYWKYTKELEAVASKQAELKQMQIEQGTYLRNYLTATAAEDRAHWWEIVVTKRKIMNSLTEEINRCYQENRDLFYSDLHNRNALRLKTMCETNGGIYVKLGQHIAMLDHVVPREYRSNLVSLLADTPPSSYESVERIFVEDLELKPAEVFDSFNIKPIASASLAQVHIAEKNGKKYAVKVQHEGLRSGVAADLLVVTKIVDVLSYYFPDFNYRWLTREMNLNLPFELNFLNEMDNINQVTQDLQNMIQTGDVAIPTTMKEYSSERILTMSFEEGFHLSNVKEMKKMGLQGIDISTMVSKIFSEQIFRTGFVHCDPHEANLLFRPHPTKRHKPQIVLLDHGLYRRLDESFRKNYCRLWQSIILADEKGIEKYGKELSSGTAYALLAAMLTLKPWDSILTGETPADAVNNSAKKASDLILLQSYAKLYYREIVDLLATVPSDLLLLFKTNDCLRHLDKIMDTPINSTAVVAKSASDVIFREDMIHALKDWQGLSSIKTMFHVLGRWLNVMTRVFLLSSLFYYGNAVKNLYYSWYSYFTGKEVSHDDHNSLDLKMMSLSY